MSSVPPLLAAAQCLLLGFGLLALESPKKSSNAILALFLTLLGGQMVYVGADEIWQLPTRITQLGCVFGFAYGPVLFLYTRSFLRGQKTWTPRDWIHFIPALLFVLSAYFDLKLAYRFGWLLYISLITYVVFCFRNAGKVQKLLEASNSISESSFAWLKKLLLLFVVLLILDIVEQMGGIPRMFQVSLVHLGIIVFINLIVWFGVRQAHLFLGVEYPAALTNHAVDVVLNEDSGSHSHAEVIERIHAFLEHHPLYLTNNCPIKEFSDALGLPQRVLSEAINSHEKMNYSRFFNKLRIEYAIRRFRNPESSRETIKEVMYSSGFRSKSAFNESFRDYTGKTPTQYRKEMGSKTRS